MSAKITKVVTEDFSRGVVEIKVTAAIKHLIENDAELLERDVNERTISQNLAKYLESEFPTWNVDCEYNRKGHDKKRINLPTKDTSIDDTKTQIAIPDIIIHHRGTEENLLVIEIKKSTSQVSIDLDLQKLNAFKHQLGYRHALFLKFSIGKEKTCEKRWIE